MIKLCEKEVERIFLDCLIEGAKTKEDAIERGGMFVKGVLIATYFDPEKVDEHREEIAKLLSQICTKFRKDEGGGWSFLNFCEDVNGDVWAGFHKVMDVLVCLGLAIGKIQFCAPREMWSLLPGGVPYLVIV